MGSELYGDDPEKSIANVQGDIGCLVQNDYSWIITSFAAVSAGAHIMVTGIIEFPSEQTASLGTGEIITYGDTDPSNTRDNSRLIDYLSTNFPLQV